MQHFTLSIAHVTLQFSKQGDGSCYGHVLKHILLPVLTHGQGILRQLGGEVAGNNLALYRVLNHRQDAITIGVDGTFQLFAFASTR